MVGLKSVLQEIIYAEVLFGFVMIFTGLFLSNLFNVKHIQNTRVEALMMIGAIIVIFGIPYIMIQSSFFIGMLIVAVISIFLTVLFFIFSIETSHRQ